MKTDRLNYLLRLWAAGHDTPAEKDQLIELLVSLLREPKEEVHHDR